MKWVLILILIIVIMLIAYSISEQYKDKFDFYDNLKEFLNQFKINLSFKQEKILNFLNNTKSRKQFGMFVEAYKGYVNHNEINLREINILDDDEKRQLEEIITNIGMMDVANEIKQIENFIVQIEEKRKKAKEDKNKLCPMIIKLSLLFALGVAIILI